MAVELTARTRLSPAVVLAATGVAAQVVWPLVHGTTRSQLTAAVVVLFAATSLCHAWSTRGPRVAAALAVATCGVGFGVEIIGVATGFPFGDYDYGDALGPTVLGVPPVIALAWTMLAWPAALAARVLVRSFPARVLVGGWALATWDLFLDPQMVREGYWTWADPSPALPGVPTVPLSDYAGWLVVATAISFLVQRVLTDAPHDDRVPLGLYLWTWASSTLALAAFLDLRAAACYGALGMGTIAIPLLRRTSAA